MNFYFEKSPVSKIREIPRFFTCLKNEGYTLNRESTIKDEVDYKDFDIGKEIELYGKR